MLYSKLFEEILAKPGMYVGNCSIIGIRAFIDGYRHAKWETGDSSQDDLYNGFTQWLAERFNITSSHEWSRIISFMSNSEADAFENTKKLWSEYKAQFYQQK